MKRGACAAAALAAVFVGSLVAPVAAGPDSEVASAFDLDDPFDIHLSFDYRFTSRRSSIRRELAGGPGADPDQALPIVDDLVFSGARHEMAPRIETGVFTDLALTLELPVVVRESRRLEFADSVDAAGSTTVDDNLVPETGIDAQNPGAIESEAAFRGRNRAGLDQVHLGLVWAPLNQARDHSKPTWKAGAEVRLSIGEVMAFNRNAIAAENGVSRGVHELKLYTSMARRTGWAEPFFELWWLGAIGARRGAPLDDVGRDFGGARNSPQQRAGGRFGLEAIAWERGAMRISAQLGAEIEMLFEGRAYTDMWEVFAYAGHAPSRGPLSLDADPVEEGQQPRSHPGASNVENYMTVAAQAGIEAHVTDQLRVDLGFRLGWEQSHLISFADAGQDGDDENDVVDPGTEEVNPLHVPLVDTPGHRYRVDDVSIYALTLGVRMLF